MTVGLRRMVRAAAHPLVPSVFVLVALLVSAPALLARHQTETALPAMRQAVTDTTLERWVEVERGPDAVGPDAGRRAEERVEQRLVHRLAAAGIDTVVLGMRPDLRYDPERVRRLAELDVRVILAVPTFAPMDAALVHEQVRRAAERTGANVLLPQPTQSFPSLPSNADWMREYDLALTDLAGGTTIAGIDLVARPGHAVRTHEIPVGFDDSGATVQSRALRAVKERDVRLIVYRYAVRQHVAPLDTTLSIAERVAERLPVGVSSDEAESTDGEHGGDARQHDGRGLAGAERTALVGGASALTEPEPAWAVPGWIGLPVGLLGATAAALLVAAPPRSVPPRRSRMTMFTWSFGSFRGGRSTTETPEPPTEGSWRIVVVRLTAALAVTVATGLVVAASGASWSRMVGIDSFTGVKLLLLGPPLLIAGLGGWRHRASIGASATPRRLALVSMLAVVVLGVYLVRSGNVGIAFTPELWLRDRLDDLLYIRPRFKEVLLGIPALTVAALAWVRGSARRWWDDAARWLVTAVGAIGTASVVDTFAHFHTPIWAGLLRTGYAIVIGVPLGLLVWWLWKRSGWRRKGALP